MTNLIADPPLTASELIVLARLSSPRVTSEAELGNALSSFALPTESPAMARAAAVHALTALCARGWAQVAKQRRTLTPAGAAALRTAFQVTQTPTWQQVRDQHLPALALAAYFGRDEAYRVLRKKKPPIVAAVLQLALTAPPASATPALPSAAAVADKLLAEALGMAPPHGKLTMSALRVHVLTRRAEVSQRGSFGEVAARVAVVSVQAQNSRSAALRRALTLRWARAQQASHTLEQPETPTAPPPRTAGAITAPPSSPATPTPPVITPPAPRAAAPHALALEPSLLRAVHQVIPHIGADGRFGDEKVFVSAIWRRLEPERRDTDLTYERFKRWLLAANRAGTLILARADLVSAMDAKLVADSEIEDQGATFHFVLDPKTIARTSPSSAERRRHAR